jgi:lipooligosaccharide transport system permease protein
VELVRGFTTGSPRWGMLWHAAYLVALTAVGLWVAGRRMGLLLLK